VCSSDLIRWYEPRQVHEVFVKGEDRSGQNDQIGDGDGGLQIPGGLGYDSKGLGPPSRGRTVAVADDGGAGHSLAYRQRDRTAQKPQPDDGNLT
jgi:hypothetical protein